MNEDTGKTVEEIAQDMELKEMKAQAQILEMVGDLHSVDEKPPDNVLFVCKLNPTTNDEVAVFRNEKIIPSFNFVFCSGTRSDLFSFWTN